jgi:DNA-binding MarR family transcriptional regulator
MNTVARSPTARVGMTAEGGPFPSSGTRDASSLPVAHPTANATTDPKQQEIRLALRLVVHLARMGPLEPGVTTQPESTQQGIASRLGVTQGAVSKVLAELAAVDVVGHARHHVRGRNRRMRAYYLTPRGLDIARRCREQVPGSELLV